MKINRALSPILIFTVSFSITISSLAVPADSSKEAIVPALFSAIIKEDKEFYSKEMRKLLEGPVAKFVENVFYTTSSGDNIFHLMAGAQSHQEFFTNEMQVLSYSAVPKGTDIKYISLGGIQIPVSKLEHTVNGLNFKKALNNNLDIVKTLSVFKTSSQAKRWFGFLYSDIKKDQSVKDYIHKLYKKNKVSSIKKIFEQAVTIETLELRKGLTDLDLYFRFTHYGSEVSPVTKNKQKLSPKDIAYKVKNKFAYSFLSGYAKKTTHRFSIPQEIGQVIGIVLGIAIVEQLGFSTWPILPLSSTEPETTANQIAGVSGFLIGGTAGGVLGRSCYNLFKTKKLKQHFNKKPATTKL